ncbi:MAG: BlaB/IND/MUS family subclass B1 metallo-beta-lactamase [Ignavibacteriae bacterium]|nr:BlaB/IND/MUS family subclass B1 metallo-beta-lactamase [Ignavibacteriota bacterium]
MKPILTLLFGILLTSTLYGKVPEAKLKISHLTGDFYVFTTYRMLDGNPFPANGMYVITNDGAIMIDSPWDTTQFQPLQDSIESKHNVKVIMCVATHSHNDRTAGLEFYRHQGIKTYTSLQTDSISREKNEKLAEFHFENDTTFTIGQYSFQTVFAGGGHTSDNIVIWFAHEKILYGGCLIKSTDSPVLGNLADAKVRAWASTIKTIQTKCEKPNYIIPGHQGWKNKKSLEHTLKLVEDFKSKNMSK